MQENINKWPENENQARKVAGGIHELSIPWFVQSTSRQSVNYICKLSSNRSKGHYFKEYQLLNIKTMNVRSLVILTQNAF